MTAATLLVTMLAVPLVAMIACLVARGVRAAEIINLAAASLTLLLGAMVVVRIAQDGPVSAFFGLLAPDELSALMVGTVSVLGFATALVSIRYLRHDLAHGEAPGGELGVRLYYAGLHGFVWTMLVTVTVDNLGLLWVGVEATTLASALLVGFYRHRAALEATWKYVIICTVGITCALFGVMLTYFAARIGAVDGMLNWSSLVGRAGDLDPALMRLAFVFILIGFGTKAGFAPLHTWLADAHSQAPSPVSGLLSGVLLSCALYGIIRFHTLTTLATGSEFSHNLLIGFGLLSIAIAAPFILLARDVKRMLAYSSVEHIGLMALAFGIGGPAAIIAGLLHLMNHAAAKGLLFFVTGEIVQQRGSRRIRQLRGLLRTAPLLGGLFLMGALAITGAPPFGIFTSEVLILTAGFGGRTVDVIAAAIALALLALTFAALLRHAFAIAYGEGDAAHKPTSASRGIGLPGVIALAPLVAVMLLFGVHVPGPVHDLLQTIAAIIEPTTREVATR